MRAISRVLAGLVVTGCLGACAGAGPSAELVGGLASGGPGRGAASTREAILASVGRATARPPLTLRPVTINGVEYREAEIVEGHAHVVVARVGPGGALETQCVSDAETARAFLSAEVGVDR